VYYLTFDELTGELPADCRACVDERRAVYNEYLALVLPDQWVGVPAAQHSRAAERDVAEVRGMPVSAGTVEGIARVVHDADAGDLEAGEILVCATTGAGGKRGRRRARRAETMVAPCGQRARRHLGLAARPAPDDARTTYSGAGRRREPCPVSMR
jgi:hypothetical protein